MLTARVIRICLAGCVLSFVGCGGSSTEDGPTGEVNGKVLLENGKPLTEGTVELYSEETMKPYGGDIQSDGTFKADSPVPIGKYQVAFHPPATDVAPTDEGSAKALEKPSPIHRGYQEASSSGFEIEVKEGENKTFEFKLLKKGPKGYNPDGVP